MLVLKPSSDLLPVVAMDPESAAPKDDNRHAKLPAVKSLVTWLHWKHVLRVFFFPSYLKMLVQADAQDFSIKKQLMSMVDEARSFILLQVYYICVSNVFTYFPNVSQMFLHEIFT